MRGIWVGVALAGIVLGVDAQAEESWVLVSESAKGAQYYVRVKDITNASNYPTLWVKGDFSKDKTVPFRVVMAQYQIDCANQTSVTKARIIYRPDMTIKSSDTYPSAQPKPIPPETVMDGIARNVCRSYGGQ